jgi:cysteine desulfurase NifS
MPENPESTIVKRGLCGICPAGCWVKITLDINGTMLKVEADDESPNGMICKIGEHSPEIVYSNDRLKYPTKRVGGKGSFDFERISWEEAYNTIVEKLNGFKEKHGPESTAIYTGRGSFELSLCDVYQPKNVAISSASSVLFPFGSPNTLGVGALCYVSFAMIAPHVTMGGYYFNMFSDIEKAEMVVIWGANPATDSPPTDYFRIIEAQKRGAKIVVIDPRKTAMAKLSGAVWIPIKPGTDGALALGLCNILIREELYDFKFIEEWTLGFEDFKTYAQQFRPEVVEEITGVKPNILKELAYDLVQKQGVAPVMYTGLEYTNSGVQNIRATFVLWAMAGQMDVPGGRNFSMTQNLFKVCRDGLLANPDMNKALGRDRFPVYSQYRGESHAISLPESVLESKPYKIRSLIIHGGSISTSWPQTNIWKKTLNELEFLVCIDRTLTADCAYADIVLPATTMYEIDSYMTYGSMFKLREKIIEPVGESRNDFFIMAELARRLGYGELYPQNEEELLNYVLTGTGFTADEVRKNGGDVANKSIMMQYKKWEKGLLRKDGKPGFDTPSGKFEIKSSILEEHGYDGLPIFQEPLEGPSQSAELSKKYPLIFNSGSRVDTDFRSQHHGVKGLSKERPEPTVMMNTEDAKQRGIVNGDKVLIASPRGKVSMRALVTNDIVKGAVDANMGGGGPLGSKAWQKANVNTLTDLQNYDPISGFPVYKALLCEIQKEGNDAQLIIGSGEKLIKTKMSTTSNVEFRDVYLDNNATTPIHEEVKKVMVDSIEKFANPSGIYKAARENKFAIESARRNAARLLNTTARRIVFTSCGSESNNLAIRGLLHSMNPKENHLITTSIEHPSVLKVFQYFEKQGFEVTYLNPDKEGVIQPTVLQKAIKQNTALVSIMLANNETGAIQPIRELCKIAHKSHALFHTDAVQAIGKIQVDVENLGVDMLSISGHKLYAPKGVGILFIRDNVSLEPLIYGGGQENNQRAGTENVINIMAMGKACELAVEHLLEYHKVQKLKESFEKELLILFPEAKINSQHALRLPNTINITLPEIRGEAFLLTLDKKGISFSSASACKSGSSVPSHVLSAMGLSVDEAHCTVRISLGIQTNKEDISYTLKQIKETLSEFIDKIRFIACR